MNLTDKTVLVTGGAQGIGFAVARAFEQHQADVIVADLDEAKAAAAADRLGSTVSAHQVDVTSETSVDELFEAALDRHGRVDILVNSAGIVRDGMIHRLELSDLQSVMAVHVQGTWLCCRSALRHMRTREGGGAIVNLSSMSGKVGNLGQSNYAAAKAGIVGLTKSVAREGARFNVRANALLPGLIRTPMTEAMPSAAWKEKLAEIPLARAGEPSEVADAALFLASDLSSYITGTTLEISGGRHM